MNVFSHFSLLPKRHSRRFSVGCLVFFLLGCQTSRLNEQPAAHVEEVFWDSPVPDHGAGITRFSSTQVTSSFGSFGAEDFSGAQLRSLNLSYGRMLSGTEMRLPSWSRSSALCGPSTGRNELYCVNRGTGEELSRLPVPGDVTARPLFHRGSWILATSKGFLFRTSGLSDAGAPVLGIDNLSFWGSQSRERMGYLREAYRQAEGDPTRPESGASAGSERKPQALQFIQLGWDWYLWSSAEFVGHFVIQGGNVIGQTSNQYVYALDFESGQVVWTQRLPQSDGLRLSTQTLAVSSSSIVVGGADGQVRFLDPKTGQVVWLVRLESPVTERFKGLVAEPLVVGHRVIVSSPEGETQLLNEKSKTSEWQLAVGSVATPVRRQDEVFLGSSSGELLRIQMNNGEILGRNQVGQGMIRSLFYLEKGDLLLVAFANGKVAVVDPGSLEVTQNFHSRGDAEGEFFDRSFKDTACMSLREGGVRCFQAWQ